MIISIARALFAPLLLLTLALSACSSSNANARSQPPLSEDSGARVLRHIVLFKFKDDAPAEEVRRIEQAFAALPAQIPEIKGFEWGTDVGVEGKAQGFTHAFLVTFADEAARDVYLPHPAHRAFGALMRPQLDKVLVLDYWNRP